MHMENVNILTNYVIYTCGSEKMIDKYKSRHYYTNRHF